MKTSRNLVINFSIILLLALLLMTAHGVSTAEELSGEMGDPNDMYLKFTASGAYFLSVQAKKDTWVGYSDGGPVTISGEMTVKRDEGMKSGVSMDAYLGTEKLKIFPKEGEDGNVMGKTVTRSFSLTYNPFEGEEIVMGRVTLYVCGGVCTEYTQAFHVLPYGDKFGPQITAEEAEIKKGDERREEALSKIDCSKYYNSNGYPICDDPVKISSFHGEVEVIPCGGTDEDRSFARLTMKVCPGARIISGDDSGIILQFLDLSTFVMKSNSEIVIGESPKQCSNFDLITGVIMGNIERMMKGGSIQIRTDRCITGVEGTTYVLEDDGNQTTLKTLEGKVWIESLVTGVNTSVEAGEMILATNDGLTEIETFDVAAEQAEWEIDELEDAPSDKATDTEESEGFGTFIWIGVLIALVALVVCVIVIRKVLKK